MFQEIARWVWDSEIERFLGDGWDGGKGFFYVRCPGSEI